MSRAGGMPERERLKSTAQQRIGIRSGARLDAQRALHSSGGRHRNVFEAVQRLGFTHGRVLEPAAWHRAFLRPDAGGDERAFAAHGRSKLDPLTASIARRLYPDADIRSAQGFESGGARGELVRSRHVSNVPFGDYKLHDPQLNERNFLVHDYFFAQGHSEGAGGWVDGFHHAQKGTLDKANSHLARLPA